MVSDGVEPLSSELTDLSGVAQIVTVQPPGPAERFQVVVPTGTPELPNEVSRTQEVPTTAAALSAKTNADAALSVVTPGSGGGGWAIVPDNVVDNIDLPFPDVFRRNVE